MKYSSIMAFVVPFVVSGTAIANENGSEYMYQTPAGKWQVVPTLHYESAEVKMKAGGSTKTTRFGQSVRGEYGIDESFSTGLILMNSSSESKSGNSKFDATGLHDLTVFFRGRNQVGGGMLRYGLNVDFGLEKHKVKANGDENNSTGGMWATPFIGFEMSRDNCTYGGRISYKTLIGDAKMEDEGPPKVESDISGGSQFGLDLFFEHQIQQWTLGAALEITSVEKKEAKANGVTTEHAFGNTQWTLAFYTPYDVSENIELLPSVRYTTFTAKNYTIDEASSWHFAIGGRFTF